MPLLCKICRKGKGGKRFIYSDEPLDSEHDSDSEQTSQSVATFINSSIKGVKFSVGRGKNVDRICEQCFKKLKSAYKLFRSIKESDIIFRHSSTNLNKVTVFCIFFLIILIFFIFLNKFLFQHNKGRDPLK